MLSISIRNCIKVLRKNSKSIFNFSFCSSHSFWSIYSSFHFLIISLLLCDNSLEKKREIFLSRLSIESLFAYFCGNIENAQMLWYSLIMLCNVFITLHTNSLLSDFALLLKALNSILWRFYSCLSIKCSEFKENRKICFTFKTTL